MTKTTSDNLLSHPVIPENIVDNTSSAIFTHLKEQFSLLLPSSLQYQKKDKIALPYDELFEQLTWNQGKNIPAFAEKQIYAIIHTVAQLYDKLCVLHSCGIHFDLYVLGSTIRHLLTHYEHTSSNLDIALVFKGYNKHGLNMKFKLPNYRVIERHTGIVAHDIQHWFAKVKGSKSMKWHQLNDYQKITFVVEYLLNVWFKTSEMKSNRTHYRNDTIESFSFLSEHLSQSLNGFIELHYPVFNHDRHLNDKLSNKHPVFNQMHAFEDDFFPFKHINLYVPNSWSDFRKKIDFSLCQSVAKLVSAQHTAKGIFYLPDNPIDFYQCINVHNDFLSDMHHKKISMNYTYNSAQSLKHTLVNYADKLKNTLPEEFQWNFYLNELNTKEHQKYDEINHEKTQLIDSFLIKERIHEQWHWRDELEDDTLNNSGKI
jgi:hypothetical protein